MAISLPSHRTEAKLLIFHETNCNSLQRNLILVSNQNDANRKFISRKVVGKSARNNPERYCGWFWIHCCPKKLGSTATVSGTVYRSYPILPFGIVTCTFSPTTFLEITVYRSLDQLVLGTLLFAYSLNAGLQVAKVAGPKNHWPDQGPSNRAVVFYDPGFSAKLRSCRFVTS